jgi:hypothetical protein
MFSFGCIIADHSARPQAVSIAVADQQIPVEDQLRRPHLACSSVEEIARYAAEWLGRIQGMPSVCLRLLAAVIAALLISG